MRVIFAVLLSLWASAASANTYGNAGPAYPCTLMVLYTSADTAAHRVFSFTSAADVTNFFGAGGEATIANGFFAAGAKACTNQTIKYVRFPVVAARAHLNGGNLAAAIGGTPTLAAAIGTVQITSQGDTWTSNSMSLVTSGTESAILNNNASALQAALNGTNNANLPIKATTTGSTLTPTTCTFTGYLSYLTLNVTGNGSGAGGCQTVAGGGPPVGSQVCDGAFADSTAYTASNTSLLAPSCVGPDPRQITSAQENLVNSAAYLNNATTQNPCSTPNLETYSMFLRQSAPVTTHCGTAITAYWEVLTVGTLTSGTIAVGQQLEDNGGNLSANNICVIWANLSGSGSGSTWLVACVDPTVAQASEAISLSDCSLEVVNHLMAAGTSGRAYEEISVNNFCPWSAATIGYLADVSSTIAAQLMMTPTSGSGNNAAFAETPGQLITSVATGMNTVMALDPAFGTFVMGFSPYSATSNTNYQGGPAMPYGVDPALLAWSQAQPGQWPYYYEGWGGAAPSGGNFPWAR